MRAGTHQGDDCQMQGGLAAGSSNGSNAAFQSGNTFLKNSIGGVAHGANKRGQRVQY